MAFEQAPEENIFTHLPYEKGLKEVQELEMWAKVTEKPLMSGQFQNFLKLFNDAYGDKHGAYKEIYTTKADAEKAMKEWSEEQKNRF